MPVYFDTTTRGFAVFDENRCPDCGAQESLDDTGCDAPGCRGYACPDCGWGCDLPVNGDQGACGAALAAETPEARQARSDTERAGWGLPPLH